MISAFIKSIRGSDPDAGLYWLARMLEAGEDARFIARRLVILASEDVGMADPMALVVADAAARAVEFVGLPEAQLNLAQAVVHLATAPKSNRTAIGHLERARRTCAKGVGSEVPTHLRDAHYQGAKVLGHGKGYDYPHDDPRGWVAQEYRPDDVADRTYYEPSRHGFEQEVAQAHGRAARNRGRVVTAGDLALVLTTVLCVLGFIGLALVLMRMLQALREIQAAVDDLRAKTEPLLAELRESVEEARDDLDRFDRRARLGRGHLGRASRARRGWPASRCRRPSSRLSPWPAAPDRRRSAGSGRRSR